MDFSYGPFITGIVATAAGLAIGLRGFRNLLSIRASKSWPFTPARIRRMEMQTWNADSSPHHSLDLEYEYDVDGQTFTATRPAFYPVNTKASIEPFIERQRGRPVAYYNPDRPGEAVLELTGTKPLHTLAFGGLILIVGVVLIVLGTRG